MDLPCLENYPTYTSNVVPEISKEGYMQISQQIPTSEPLPSAFDVPNVKVKHQVSKLNTETTLPTISPKTNTKSIGKLSMKNNSNLEQYGNQNTFTSKYINGLSSLLSDEDMQTTNNKVVKYDSTTDTTVVFHLVKPSDFEENHIDTKITKRGRPRKDVIKSTKTKTKQRLRKDVTKSTKTKTKQDTPSQQFKPENIIQYPLISTKSGRLSRPPKYLLNEFSVTNNDNIRSKKFKYKVKSVYLCEECCKTYSGYKPIEEHLKRFPSHTVNIIKPKTDSELQDTLKIVPEAPLFNTMNGKKKAHTLSKVLKDQHCDYIKSKKNLELHLQQIMKQVKKPDIIKSLIGTISIWDLLSNILESGNLQKISKELNTLMTNLPNISKSLKLVSKCETNSVDNQMFINDSLGRLFGLPNGCYSLQNIENDCKIEQDDDWTINSVKPVQLEVPTPQNLNCHSSPINLNLFDSQSPEVEFWPSSSIDESKMCVKNQEALESLNDLISESLCMSDLSEYCGHSSVPIIDYPIESKSSASNVSQPDSFMDHGAYDVFSNDLNMVPTSTEEFFKSLEQYEPPNDTGNTLNSEIRILDFEDLHNNIVFHVPC